MRTVADGISYHCHGLDGWMEIKVRAIAAKAINAGVAPDVRTVSAVLAQLDIVNVWRGA